MQSYGPKFVENIVQAISRDLLRFSMKNLAYCFICSHVHDELIIKCSKDISVEFMASVMSLTLEWMPDIQLRSDGYETPFYKKTDTKQRPAGDVSVSHLILHIFENNYDENSFIISSIMSFALSIPMPSIILKTRSSILFSVFESFSMVFKAL